MCIRREKLKSGFAFVEFMLLITTTIIIASVLTLYLVKHSKGAKLAPMFVKTISSINQAALMSKAQHDFSYADADVTCSDGTEPVKKQQSDTDHTFCAIFNDNLQDALYRGKVSDVKYYKNGVILSYVLYEKDVLPEDYRDYVAYTLKDGTIIAFNPDAVSCSREYLQQGGIDTIFDYDSEHPLAKCVGFIDVNGTESPNKEITCKKGENLVMQNTSDCVVDMSEKRMNDVFPVLFYDTSVEPATSAGKYVMSNRKG